MKIGYARVSKFEQNLDLQKDALKLAGCEKIYTDKLSGNVKDRPGLDKIKEVLRPGDKLIVWRFDRLGRSVKHLVQFVTQLEEMGVIFESINEKLDTSTPAGKLMLHMFFAFAEFERNLISERTRTGLESARARGRKGGRPFKLTNKEVKKLRKLYEERNLGVDSLCKLFGISPPTLYKYVQNENYIPDIEEVSEEQKDDVFEETKKEILEEPKIEHDPEEEQIQKDKEEIYNLYFRDVS